MRVIGIPRKKGNGQNTADGRRRSGRKCRGGLCGASLLLQRRCGRIFQRSCGKHFGNCFRCSNLRLCPETGEGFHYRGHRGHIENMQPSVRTIRLALSSVLSMGLFCAHPAAAQETFPTNAWAKAEPSAVGLDAKALAAFDADIASGKYGLVDSMLVIRCGKQAYARTYPHDYA